MRAVVMGYHTMGCVGFEALLRHGFEVTGVFTHRDDPGEEIWWRSLAELAAEHQVPVHYPQDPRGEELREQVAACRPEFLFSFYYRHLLPPSVLSLAPRGALNLHGSLLPKLRGRAPVNWALVLGERTTGVSLHYMVAKPDAGDLVDQEAVDVLFEDTAYTLFHKLEGAAGRLLDRALPALRAGTASQRSLDLAQGSYYGGRRPKDGEIDWAWDARRIYDLVRAVTHPYPGAFTYFGGRKLWVWWALPCSGEGPAGTVLSCDREGITVAAGQGAVRLILVQMEDQPQLPASALATLLPIRAGSPLGEKGSETCES